MNIQKVIEHCGSKYNLARLLGVSPSAVSHWVKSNQIPALQQFRLQGLTGGKFKVEKKFQQP